MVLCSLYEASITLVPKPEKDTQRQPQASITTGQRPIGTNVLSKIPAQQTQQHVKRTIHNDYTRFIPETQGWFNIYRTQSMSPYSILTNQKRNHLISSTESRKNMPDKMQHSFLIEDPLAN